MKKKNDPDMMIALCGCMMQEASGGGEDQEERTAFVDVIFGTHNIYKFAELRSAPPCISRDRMVIDIWKDTDKIVEDLPSERKYSV